MSNRNKIIYLTYAILISILILYHNPTLFSQATLASTLIPNSDIWNAVLLSADSQPQVDQKDTNPVYYRNSPDRRAIFHLESLQFELKPLWSTSSLNVGIHSASKASAVSDGERIYIGDDTSWFSCFDNQGTLLWKIYLADSTRGIHSTAIVDGDSVYVGSYRGALYKINKFTGRILWSRILGHTLGASPLLIGDKITLSVETLEPNGYLIQVDKNSGEIVWRGQNLGEQAHSSPSLDKESGVLVVGANNSTLQGFDYQSGKHLWTTPVGGSIKSTAFLNDGIGFITSWGQEILSFNVKTGEILWRYAIQNKSQVSPVYLKESNLVFAADSSGQMYGVDAKTGQERWQISKNKFRQLSSPVIVSSQGREKILFACAHKELCLINSAGKIEKSWPLEKEFSGSLFISNKTVYLAGDTGGLQALQLTF